MVVIRETVDLHRSSWWRYLRESVHLEDLAINRTVIKWMLYVFFWVIPRRLNFICRRFGTLCSNFIGK
jgi:hypothetical protein